MNVDASVFLNLLIREGSDGCHHSPSLFSFLFFGSLKIWLLSVGSGSHLVKFLFAIILRPPPILNFIQYASNQMPNIKFSSLKNWVVGKNHSVIMLATRDIHMRRASMFCAKG